MKTFKRFLKENFRNAKVTPGFAKMIGDQMGVDWKKYDLEQFRKGLEVEQEHAYGNPFTDIADPNSWPTIAKIALAHLDEIRFYYTELKKMEERANS